MNAQGEAQAVLSGQKMQWLQKVIEAVKTDSKVSAKRHACDCALLLYVHTTLSALVNEDVHVYM